MLVFKEFSLMLPLIHSLKIHLKLFLKFLVPIIQNLEYHLLNYKGLLHWICIFPKLKITLLLLLV